MEFGVFDTTDGHVGEEREEVSWSAFGVFADETRRVGTGGAVRADEMGR